MKSIILIPLILILVLATNCQKTDSTSSEELSIEQQFSLISIEAEQFLNDYLPEYEIYDYSGEWNEYLISVDFNNDSLPDYVMTLVDSNTTNGKKYKFNTLALLSNNDTYSIDSSFYFRGGGQSFNPRFLSELSLLEPGIYRNINRYGDSLNIASVGINHLSEASRRYYIWDMKESKFVNVGASYLD